MRAVILQRSVRGAGWAIGATRTAGAGWHATCQCELAERETWSARARFVQNAVKDVLGGSPLRRIAVSAVRERIADVLAYVDCRRERVVLTRHGRSIGAIVSMSDLERLEALDADAAEDLTPTVAAFRASWRRLTDDLERHR